MGTSGAEAPRVRVLDLRRQLRSLYAPPPGPPRLVDVPPLTYVAIDGEVAAGSGPGDAPAFQAALQAIYGAAWTLKMTAKRRAVDPVDYPVMPLEGLWPAEIVGWKGTRREPWPFTLLILVPDETRETDLATAVGAIRAKRGDTPELKRLRLERLEEGRCVQALHVGPYATEAATIAAMHEAMGRSGMVARGRHHEIYLGDPRRSAPDRLRTILRQPVAAVSR